MHDGLDLIVTFVVSYTIGFITARTVGMLTRRFKL